MEWGGGGVHCATVPASPRKQVRLPTPGPSCSTLVAYGDHAHVRGRLRDRARARPHRRALGAARRARAAARSQALHRPPRRAPQRQPQRARPAPPRPRAGRRSSRRRKLPPPASSWIYELTDWGHELKPIVISLGKWALRSPSFPDEAPVGTDSIILALGTFFDAEAAGDLRARYELRLGEHTFDVHIADGAIALERGSVADPDAVIETDSTTLSAVLWNGRDLADALREGDISVVGDQRAFTRFAELFPRPLATVHE